MALERVAPLVGASFGCLFLFEEEGSLLRVATAFNWPQRYASYLGSMRVRPGNGPTGRAVLEHRLIDVADVFADPEHSDWWDSARELGFDSAIALPMMVEGEPIGALTFYFRGAEGFRDADRQLLRLVADQLAATAVKAQLIEDLQQANDRLRVQNLDLESRYQEAEAAKQVRNEFLANISHELRTPLTAILGYAFLLKEEITGPLLEQQSEAVSKIEKAGSQLVELIDGMLELTQLKLGNLEAEPELCDAAALARTASANAPQPAPGVELHTEAADEPMPIHTDPAIVLRVLQALLSNALKFTQEGSVTLRVRLEAPQQAAAEEEFTGAPDVVWEVVDTGVGVDAADHEVIFDEFRQVDGSATRRFGGAGVGLALARGLARTLGGDIRVRSELGSGATFIFTLPSSVIRAGTGNGKATSSF